MNRSKRKKFARSLAALAVPVTTVTLSGNANAACAPAAPVTDATVICTGATNNQNGTTGYGDAADARNTINVLAGASVTGTDLGIRLTGSGDFENVADTVINLGAISGANGISGFSGVVHNAAGATIVGTGVNGVGYLIDAQGTLDNSGTISGNAEGVSIRNGSVFNSVFGIISGGNTGVTIQDQGLGSEKTPTVVNVGRITGSATGVRFRNAISASGELTNSGTISATGANGAAAAFDQFGTVTNSGTIAANGTTAVAINAGADVRVTNNSGGTVSGRFAGIQAGGTATVTNAQGALIEATEPSFGAAAIFGGALSVQNSGTIRGLGASASAIVAGDSGLILANTSSGAISGGGSAVSSRGILTVTGNEGLIESNGGSSFAILGRGDVNVSNGNGTIRASGNNSLAIASNGTATIANGGGLIQTFDQGGTTIFGINVQVSNAGIIGAAGLNGIAIWGRSTADVTNLSGIIESTGNNGTAIFSERTATVVNSSGRIQTSGENSSTIPGTDVKITGNTGTIEATGVNGIAIQATETADVTNSGTIRSTGDNGIAIQAANALINNNAGGAILGNSGAIRVDTGTINNAGTLSSTKVGSISTIRAATSATVNNSGTILGPDNGFAIFSPTGRLDVVNSGTIIADGSGIGIEAAIVNVTNTGTIDAGSHGIVGTTGTIENFGTISTRSSGIVLHAGNVTNVGTIQATGTGIKVDNGTVSNSGSILGEVGVHPSTFAMVTNSGAIQGIGPTGFGIFADNSANVFNTGTVSGNIGIQADGRNNTGTVITNAGTIAGTGGTAIKLSPAADTLTLLPGSRIIGVVDMGGGADTINVFSSTAITSRVSSLFKAVKANLPDLINFTGIINTINNFVTPNGVPTVQSGDTVATLDPTALGQADRALMNFTGGISSLVQGRLGGAAANGSAVRVVSFAPTGASGRTEEAFAAISAMGYAKERPLTYSFIYADAPYNVWTSGFGGTATQRGDDTMLCSVASAAAGVIGFDRQVRPDLLIGAFAGGGAGRLSVELNSQSVDTDYMTVGVYGRFDWVSHFLDFTLQSGATTNKSKRQVLNDSVPTGMETGTASYDSWYISPEIAYGRRYHFANGYTLTPMGRIRYLAGTFDGYNETGSAQNLTVGRRTVHDLEERAEVELSKITGVGAGSFRTSVYGGFIALQRLGNLTINTVLIGQDLSFATPGNDSTAGVVAGAGFDLRATDRMSLFGAFEATLMSDRSRTAAAKAGLKFAF